MLSNVTWLPWRPYIGHEVITGHHGNLQVHTSFTDDFLYSCSTCQGVHSSRITDDSNACGEETLMSAQSKDITTRFKQTQQISESC